MKRVAVLLLLLLPVVFVGPETSFADEEKDRKEEKLKEAHERMKTNWEWELPYGWEKLSPVGNWDKLGIIAGATRELKELKSGDEAKGEGGLAHISVIRAPEEMTIDQIAKDEDQQGFLMKRFGSSRSKWPEIDIVGGKFEETDELEYRILTAEGEANNLKGKKAPTKGVMILFLWRGILLRVRMYAWYAEHDDEGMKDDLDFIEAQFWIFDRSTDPAARPPTEAPVENGGEEIPEGDRGDIDEEKVIDNIAEGWRLVKPVGIKSKEDWDRDQWEYVRVWFEDNDRNGSYQIILSAFRKGRIVNGVRAPDVDLRDWITTKWYPVWTANHTGGIMQTFKWPRKRPSFITLPDFEKPIMIFEKPNRRPAEAKYKDMFSWKAAEKVKGWKLGEVKPNEAYRGCLSGNRDRVGPETNLRFAWGSASHSFELTISLARDPLMRWEEPIRQLLESIEIIKD